MKFFLNFISLIPVNPQKFPRVNYEDTMTFVKWLTSPEKGQKIIGDFGKDKYGAPSSSPIPRNGGKNRVEEVTNLKRPSTPHPSLSPGEREDILTMPP